MHLKLYRQASLSIHCAVLPSFKTSRVLLETRDIVCTQGWVKYSGYPTFLWSLHPWVGSCLSLYVTLSMAGLSAGPPEVRLECALLALYLCVETQWGWCQSSQESQHCTEHLWYFQYGHKLLSTLLTESKILCKSQLLIPDVSCSFWSATIGLG